MGGKNAEASLITTAAEWRLISLLLQRPRPGWLEEVGALAREVRDERLCAAAAAACDATEGAYLRLIGPGGAVSPREVASQPFQDPGHLLAQLATTYGAFASSARGGSNRSRRGGGRLRRLPVPERSLRKRPR